MLTPTQPKLYSEELILACVSAIKNQLSNIIYPFAEGLGDIYGQYSMSLGGFPISTDQDPHQATILLFLNSRSTLPQVHLRHIEGKSAPYSNRSARLFLTLMLLCDAPRRHYIRQRPPS